MGAATPPGVVIAAACAAVAAATAGRVVQRRAEQAARALTPAGQLVDVGQAILHTVVRGEGPVVVLEAGAGATLDSWALVMPLLQPHTTVVAYDRAGLGFSTSETADLDRRPLAVADRLASLLSTLELPPPYVLVGHSIGGLHVRAFAHEHPSLVRAIILLDPSHEQMRAALGDVPWPHRAAGAVLGALLRACAAGAPVGMHRLLEPLTSVTRIARRHGLDARAAAVTGRTARVVRAQAAERQQVEASLAQAAQLGPPTVTCTVLSGDRFAGGGRSARARAAVNALHASLAAAAPDGQHVVVPDCGHLVPLEAPAAVAEAVLAAALRLPQADQLRHHEG